MSDRLDEIEKRCNAATEGPWFRRATDIGSWYEPTWTDGEPPNLGTMKRRDDQIFVAHARTDIPWLIAEVQRLREELLESYETYVEQNGAFCEEGERAGWWDSMAMSSVCHAADKLVEAGKWERHPDGVGRRWFYRPIAKGQQ